MSRKGSSSRDPFLGALFTKRMSAQDVQSTSRISSNWRYDVFCYSLQSDPWLVMTLVGLSKSMAGKIRRVRRVVMALGLPLQFERLPDRI